MGPLDLRQCRRTGRWLHGGKRRQTIGMGADASGIEAILSGAVRLMLPVPAQENGAIQPRRIHRPQQISDGWEALYDPARLSLPGTEGGPMVFAMQRRPPHRIFVHGRWVNLHMAVDQEHAGRFNAPCDRASREQQIRIWAQDRNQREATRPVSRPAPPTGAMGRSFGRGPEQSEQQSRQTAGRNTGFQQRVQPARQAGEQPGLCRQAESQPEGERYDHTLALS